MSLVMHAHAALACIDPGKSDQVLKTQAPRHASGIGSQMKPVLSTYDTLVALACWNGGEWPSACRAFERSANQFRSEIRVPALRLTNSSLTLGWAGA